MPIRVVTKEVRYIHELFLTLEHSMPVSSPAVPGLTNYFSQRILKLIKYFWSFCKKEKVLERFQHAENNFENFKHAMEKSKEVKRKFGKAEKQI